MNRNIPASTMGRQGAGLVSPVSQDREKLTRSCSGLTWRLLTWHFDLVAPVATPATFCTLLRRHRVGFGEPVAQDREKVNQVLLLLSGELEIADLAVRLGRSGRLGWRHSRDILYVVENLRRWEERGEAGRRALTQVESYLLAASVHGDVPLIVEMDDILETLKDAIVHVSLHETWGRSFVHVAVTRCLEESPELNDVAGTFVEEPGSVGRRIGVGTQAKIDEVSPLWVEPVRIGHRIGLLGEGVPQIFRDADIRKAVHGERVFPLRDGLYTGQRRGGVALKALCLAKV